MIAFWAILRLELVALFRTKTALLLVLASLVWLVVLPYLLRADGTAEGLRELIIRYGLGGSFGLVLVSLMASATASLARERAAKRLPLTLVKPVSRVVLVLAKGLAHLLLGAFVLTIAAGGVFCSLQSPPRCNHVLKPVLPTPREEAEAMYARYMASSETPQAVKRASKAAVLRLLETRAFDHYQVIPARSTATYMFPLNPLSSLSPTLRLHFAAMSHHRETLVAQVTLGDSESVISNQIQSTLAIPLDALSVPSKVPALTLTNLGAAPIQLRPRQDIDLLLPADAFGWNLARCVLELVAILALALAFALFLSASLSRPVALFVAIATLLVGEMSPTIVASCPEDFDMKRLDRLGLYITRAVATLTSPVAVLNPVDRLASDTRIETPEVLRTLLTHAVLTPLLLALIAALILPRKQD